MRPRKKKHGAERLNAVGQYFLNIDETGKADIAGAFRTVNRLHVEIGCGKGAYVCAMAKKEPEVSFIAVERVTDVIMLAMENAQENELKNVRFIHCDAADLVSLLPEESVDVLYINFCDPWPKKRNAKRRLTFRKYLEMYKAFLKHGGVICFKTDNRPLFDFSVPEFEAAGFRLTDITNDLHSSEYAAENVMTEYEKNFSQKGFTINRLVAHFD
ncbi:MAG TPA: tRNA (guanosine(46)-N7)-methyltransferase TrmB [Bacillota bacterium]|nr:tRNA (guanosine(46)-N7)-methyltransferase TrmB [Bacillota bacterium]